MGKKQKKKDKAKSDAGGSRAALHEGSIRDALLAGPSSHLADVDPASHPGFEGSEKDALTFMEASATEMSDLQERLYAQGRDGDAPSLLLMVQGLDTSGKGGIMRHVVGQLDPQGVSLRAFKAPTEEERQQHYLQRVREALPKPGMVGVFDRGHYEEVLVVKVHGMVPEDQIESRYDEINEFERQVADSGTTLLKVMLHISRDEQRARLLERVDRPDKHWKYNPRDVDERAHWEDYMAAYQVAIHRCSQVPWYVVPANDKWYARYAVYRLVLESLRDINPQWPTADFDVAAERERILGS